MKGSIYTPTYILVGFFGTFKRNKLLATLPKWGPIFSVSLDVKLESFSGKDDLLRLIQFIEASKDSGSSCCDVGTRVPAINIYKKKGKTFEFAMGLGKKDFADRNYKVKKGKWYSIHITQKLEDGTVGWSTARLFYLLQFLNSVLV